MAKVDLARRAEIGRERRTKTQALILEAGEMLLANRPAESLTVDAVVEAAGVAKGSEFVEKAIADTLWAQLVVRNAQAPTGFVLSVRANLRADLAEAAAQGRLAMQDLELAADIGPGILLGIMRGTLQRRAGPGLVRQALDAALRAIGASPTCPAPRDEQSGG